MDVAGSASVLATAARQEPDAQLRLTVGTGEVAAGRPEHGKPRPAILQRRSGDPLALTTPGSRDWAETDTGNRNSRPVKRPAADAQVSAQGRGRAVLRIRTQQGDVVRLTFASSQGLDIRAASSHPDDQPLPELTLNAASRARLQISIRGELSDAELGAIYGVLKQAGSLVDQFSAGKLPSAFDTAAAFQIDGQELARVSLKLGVRERLALAQAAVGRPATQTAATDTADPATASIRDADGPQLIDLALNRQPAAAPVQSPTARTDLPNPTIPAIQSAAVAKGGSGETDDAPTSSGPGLLDAIQALAELLNGIAGFLSSLLQALHSESEQTGNQQAVATTQRPFDLSFKLMVFQAVVRSVAETAAPGQNGAGLNLLSDTVEAIEAQTRPPLDTLA